jgi:hypothetical protein
MSCGRSCGRFRERVGPICLFAVLALPGVFEIARGHRDGISFWLIERDGRKLTSVLLVPEDEVEHLLDPKLDETTPVEDSDPHTRVLDAARVTGAELRLVSIEGPDRLPTGYLRVKTVYEAPARGELVFESALGGDHRVLGRFIEAGRESPFVLTGAYPRHRIELSGPGRLQRVTSLVAGLALFSALSVSAALWWKRRSERFHR